MRFTLALMALLLVPPAVFAQPAVVLVRHAERADAGMSPGADADPDLSAAGRARAETLAAMLEDARLTAIFVTEFKRTRQTAAPLAARVGIAPTVIPSKEAAGLLEKLKAASGPVLVVGHSNTLPAIVKALGVEEGISIGDADYDNMLVVTRGPTPALLRLRYP